MKLTIQREALLRPLQAVIGVVERRQTMPILSNVLVSSQNQRLALTGTDLEVELVAWIEGVDGEAEEVTIQGRKLLDICRALPEGAELKLSREGDRVVLKSGRSRFVLSTLPAAEFPAIDVVQVPQELRIAASDLRRLLEKTHFSMAHQDVRYYLNGLLIERGNGYIRAVATDGHRLAKCEVKVEGLDGADQQVIVPRKGVLELQRLLGEDGDITLRFGAGHVQADLPHVRFTSKLIDGRFPDYDRVIPKNHPHSMVADRDALREALGRASILSNEKYRGVRLEVESGKVVIQAHNPEQEEAEEELEVQYNGTGTLEIGFNVNYLMEALSAVDATQVEIALNDTNSSCLIQAPGETQSQFVVMPMRL
jgi:DNA polymerase III subunit beta